ncbi:hypothetical protein [Achromobacter xylosoxidans]|uniref:hypothetical protein n=1 Tax=Alcaligenes xylosoxydans xylosoxydans TaxID=85698 RepID=UPI0006C71603|nr:hypothetical protein [Achromobacter xylosoxidans]QQE57348.1 hypothetical protein I6H41_31510 [Achromobacter xylosoxidans]QQV16987.1 hypothetical protein I6I48_14450 [Achromobacter xylosoxidans]CUI50371.1 Uncharacterised protein [Achromobacter xylosoxidans]
MMAAGEKVVGLLVGWRGYVAAAAVGAVAAWFVLDALHGREISELRLEQSRDDLSVAREAIQQTNDDLLAMAANARAAAAAGPELTASIGALSKAVKNANPLPAGCRPDTDRVRSLTDSVRAARGAAARQRPGGAVP